MWWLWWLVAAVALQQPSTIAKRGAQHRKNTEFTIVGLFHPEQKQQEFAFLKAIEAVNMDAQVIPLTTIEPRVEYFSHFDSFNTSKRVCSMLREGVGAIFGPQSIGTTGIVQSICDNMEIPHIDMRWDISTKPTRCAINIFPDTSNLALALTKVIQDMDWKSYTILYEDYDSLIKLQEVFKAQDGENQLEKKPFTIRKLPSEDTDYRPLLKELKMAGESHIVLDCPSEKIMTILNQAKEVKLMGEYMNMIITSLDAHTVDFGDFKTDLTNITALRLVNPKSPIVETTLNDWQYDAYRMRQPFDLNTTDIKADSALIYDGVRLLALALHELGAGALNTEALNCRGGKKWKHGLEIINRMKSMQYEGLSGPMSFDESGHRVFFTLEITELTKEGFKKIGTWDIHGINYTRTAKEMATELEESITKKEFRVISKLGRPYLDHVPDHEHKEGNDRFEGYSMDLIDAISKELGFKYKFEIVADNSYGSLDKKTKQWDGLIRELRDRRADLAICDLTITYDRRSAVDFTMPFMTLGISILYKKPEKPPVMLFSFLDPLGFNVWFTTATAYLGISLLLYILSRCSPYQWENPHPCDSDPEELELTFNLSNCLWFSIGSLTTQGCDFLPKALSTRIVAGMWWLFTLIIVNSYTANLAAFITQQKLDNAIGNVHDLANQNKVKYGVMENGSTENFFKDSNDSLYTRIYSVMQSSTPPVFVKLNTEGVDRVRKAKNRGYALFMESTTIEFQMEQYCDLMQIGGTLDSKGYGIAMPQDSQFRTLISGAVLKLQERGVLRELKKKWWSAWKPNNTEYCKNFLPSSSSGNSDAFDMDNVGGVFIVLAGGCVLSFMIALLEVFWHVRKVAVKEKVLPWDVFMRELRFVMEWRSTTKPTRLLPPPASGSGSPKSEGSHSPSLRQQLDVTDRTRGSRNSRSNRGSRRRDRDRLSNGLNKSESIGPRN